MQTAVWGGRRTCGVGCQVIIAAIFEAIVRDHMVDLVLDPTEITGAIVRDLKVDRELDPTEITGAIERQIVSPLSIWCLYPVYLLATKIDLGSKVRSSEEP